MKPATCHPERKHKAHGLCRACYRKTARPASCHPDRPELARGLCGACHARVRGIENPDLIARRAARRKAYYEVHGGTLRKNEANRYRSQKGEKHWAFNIALKYGVTVEQYQAMRDSQGDACAICSQPFALETKRPAVDHCHDTGKVRGLLCQKCNTALGCAQDCPDILRSMAEYLERSRDEG